MTDNPALRARGQDVRIVLFSGAATTVKGVIGLAETSASEAGQPYGDFGPTAWLDYGGDGQEIEFLEYTDKASGDRLHRRKVKAETHRHGLCRSVMVHMVRDATVMPALPADFDSRDFSSEDFNAG